MKNLPPTVLWRMTLTSPCPTCGGQVEGNTIHSCPIEVDGKQTDAVSLIHRIMQLPREEIEEHCRIFERRAEDVPNARNNVSARIALALRMYLNGDK